MKCAQVLSLLSAYLDGAVSGTQMRAINAHLEGCSGCEQQFSGLVAHSAIAGKSGSEESSCDFSLKLRLAISRESCTFSPHIFEVLSLRLQHTLEVFTVPAMVGLGGNSCIVCDFYGILLIAVTSWQSGCSVDALHRSANSGIGIWNVVRLNQAGFAGD